jgi:hypothetical protein
LCNAAKAGDIDKFIALNMHIKKEKCSQISKLSVHFREKEKDEQLKHKATRRKEIIKSRVEICCGWVMFVLPEIMCWRLCP